jgi:signal peptidase I
MAMSTPELSYMKVVGQAMEPTYHPGDLVQVDRNAYAFTPPHRGDVVVFRAVAAGQPDKNFIKRIIGLPGDRVLVKNGTVYVNDHALNEPYELARPAYAWPSPPQPVTVPSNDYFVLGDNRNNSSDSHTWPVSPWLARRDIIGKVTT